MTTKSRIKTIRAKVTASPAFENILSAANYAKQFPDYPPLIEHSLGIFGWWSCRPVANHGNGLHGMYPHSFLPRALSLFPGAKDILHCPSGSLRELPRGHVTVDLVSDKMRHPMVIGNAAELPFNDSSFDLALSDPPYPRAYLYGEVWHIEQLSVEYATPPFPMRKFLGEAWRVLRPGGFLGMLHVYSPMTRSDRWRLRGLIGVSSLSNKQVRVFSIHEKLSR
jgi:hypothetical protein